METHEFLLIALVIGILTVDIMIRSRLARWRRHLWIKHLLNVLS